MYLEIFLNSFHKGDGKLSFAETFKALSDPVRRDILVMLRAGKMTAGDIAGRFELTNATVSYHLSQLKKADLLVERRVKNFIYYELNTSVFEEVMLWVSQFSERKDKNE